MRREAAFLEDIVSAADELAAICLGRALAARRKRYDGPAMESIAMIAREIWRHAVDTFGTDELALRWMYQPLAELGTCTPERVLLEDPHSSDVEAVLARIDYAVYG